MTSPRETAGGDLDLEKYLLGRVSGPERKRIEALLFEDERILSTIQEVEDHLIDRYVEGTLDAGDQGAFEEHFAASPERKERVAFRRALERAVSGTRGTTAWPAADSAPGHPGAHGRPPSPRLALRWRTARPWLGLASLLVLGLWMARGPLIEKAAGPRPPTPAPSSTGRVSGAPGGEVSPEPDAGPHSALPDQPDLLLRGGGQRSGGLIQRFVLPSRATVRLDAVVDGAATARQSSASIRSEGVAVWTGPGQRTPEPDRISVVVPATALTPGDYILRVVLDGNEREAAEFVFRLQAPPTVPR